MMSQLVGGVEVCGSSGAWFAGAQIIDFEPSKQLITVSFEDNSSETHEIGHVRFAAPVTQDTEPDFNIGDGVEIRREENSKFGWVAATIGAIKGGFYVCDFTYEGSQSKDVVDATELRKPNPNAALSKDNFFRTTVTLPEEVHKFCSSKPDEHKDLQKACEAMSVKYSSGKLIILSQKDIRRRVEMMKDFHIKNLEQKAKLAEKVTELTTSLEKSKKLAESNTEKFQVDKDLLKYVVGAKGTNIIKARKVKGVIQIEIDDDTATIHIFAETAEAAKKARQILEFSEDYHLVPQKLVGRIIGQKGKSIQDFVDKAQILKVKVLSKQDAVDMQIEGADETTAAFKFVGTKNNIDNAKALMDYLVTSHQELDTLQESTGQMEAQIKSYRVGSKMSGDSSGYNSDSNEQKQRRPKKAQSDDQKKPKKGANNGKGASNGKNEGQGKKGKSNERNQSEKKGQSVGQRQQQKKQAAEKPTEKTESNYPALSLDDFIPVKPKRKGYAKAAAKPSAIASEN